jgi:hypothetical protein
MITYVYSSGARVTPCRAYPATYVCGGDVRTHRYRITIAGGLGEIGREAFADFALETNGADTVLTGILDQAALYGALNRILSLGMELVELSRLNDGTS